MPDTYTKYPSNRCPRCGGFLYSAIYAIGHRECHIMKDKVACINCGRYWRLEGGIMIMWPERNGETMETTESRPSPKYKKKKAFS